MTSLYKTCMESTMHPNKPCQYYMGIPQGKKAFVEIENRQSRITFVTKQSSSSQPILVPSTYSDNVALTVLYGTMCEMVDKSTNKTNYYFTVENVHAIHGTTLTYENWGNKWTALLNYLPTLTILTHRLLIGAPLMCATSAELEATLRTHPLITPLSRVIGQNLYESQKVHIYRGSLASGWSHSLHPVRKQISAVSAVPVVPTATIRGKWWVTLSDDPEIYYLTKPNHSTNHSPLIAHVPDRVTSDLLRHEFTYSLDEQEMSEEDEEEEGKGGGEEEEGEKNERKKVCFECVWTTTRGKCGWKPVK